MPYVGREANSFTTVVDVTVSDDLTVTDDATIGGALSVSGATTITTADNTTQLSLISTDADASSGPVLELYRNSSSPADDDVLGEIEFHGENDANEKIQYGLISAKIQDASDGTEDVRLSIKTIVTGTERERITVQPSETVFNEDSVDLDFRVESNGNANMLFVDGGNDAVGIGTSSPTAPLTVKAPSGAEAIHVIGRSDDIAQVIFIEADGTTKTAILDARNSLFNIGTVANIPFQFATNNTERMRIDTSGFVGIGTSSPDFNAFGAGSGILAVASATGSAKTAMINLIGDGNDTADTRVGSLFFNDASGEGAGGTLAGVEVYRATNQATDPGGQIRFSTNSATSGYVERMRIDELGNVQLQNQSGNAVIGLLSGSGDMYLGGGTNSPSDMFLQTGGNTALSIDATGAVTKPLQPAFQAIPASDQTNFAVNAAVVVVFGTEIFDQNADFASNTFTAPVTGKYQLDVNVRLENIDSASTSYHLSLDTSNRGYTFDFDPDFGQDNALYTMSISTLADMDAGDTAIVRIVQASGTAQTDIAIESFFSGFLAC